MKKIAAFTNADVALTNADVALTKAVVANIWSLSICT